MAVDMNKLVNLDRLKEFQTAENAATASEFSTSKSYAAGAYVYYKGTLKKFKTAHTAGAWIGTDAEDATLADDVSVLKESINNIDAEQLNFVDVTGGNLFNPYTIVTGKFVTNSGAISNVVVSAYSAYIPVTKGDIVRYSKCTGSEAQTCQQYNENMEWVADARWVQVSEDDHFKLTITRDDVKYITINVKLVDKFRTFVTINQEYSEDLLGTYGKIITPKYPHYLNVPQVDEAVHEAPLTKNLIGMDSSIFYPVDWTNAEYITMSTEDGSAIGTSVDLLLFNENFELIGSINFNPNYSERTCPLDSNATATKYVTWNSTPSKNVQLEIGNTATKYESYSARINDKKQYKNLLGIAELTSVSDYNLVPFDSIITEINTLLFSTTGHTENFLFFTDPHLALATGNTFGMKKGAVQLINFMQAVYNSSPISFCLCGGDWLGQQDNPINAMSKLTYIDGMMREKFDRYLPIIGNHDTNYQGTEQLSNDILMNCYQKFRQEQRNYYKYEAPTSTLYVFDTGKENEQLDSYQNEQIAWFAESLLNDNSAHIIIALHIVYYSGTSIEPITNQILKVAQAYNARTSITYNGNTYNYSSATGKVSFCIGGHLHADTTAVINDIPVLITTTAAPTTTYTCTFDVCIADWVAKKLYIKRVGTGTDRTIDIL